MDQHGQRLLSAVVLVALLAAPAVSASASAIRPTLAAPATVETLLDGLRSLWQAVSCAVMPAGRPAGKKLRPGCQRPEANPSGGCPSGTAPDQGPGTDPDG
jgi:hypothetical protein